MDIAELITVVTLSVYHKTVNIPYDMCLCRIILTGFLYLTLDFIGVHRTFFQQGCKPDSVNLSG